eukprot:gene24485-biopygen20899
MTKCNVIMRREEHNVCNHQSPAKSPSAFAVANDPRISSAAPDPGTERKHDRPAHKPGRHRARRPTPTQGREHFTEYGMGSMRHTNGGPPLTFLSGVLVGAGSERRSYGPPSLGHHKAASTSPPPPRYPVKCVRPSAAAPEVRISTTHSASERVREERLRRGGQGGPPLNGSGESESGRGPCAGRALALKGTDADRTRTGQPLRPPPPPGTRRAPASFPGPPAVVAVAQGALIHLPGTVGAGAAAPGSREWPSGRPLSVPRQNLLPETRVGKSGPRSSQRGAGARPARVGETAPPPPPLVIGGGGGVHAARVPRASGAGTGGKITAHMCYSQHPLPVYKSRAWQGGGSRIDFGLDSAYPLHPDLRSEHFRPPARPPARPSVRPRFFYGLRSSGRKPVLGSRRAVDLCADKLTPRGSLRKAGPAPKRSRGTHPSRCGRCIPMAGIAGPPDQTPHPGEREGRYGDGGRHACMPCRRSSGGTHLPHYADGVPTLPCRRSFPDYSVPTLPCLPRFAQSQSLNLAGSSDVWFTRQRPVARPFASLRCEMIEAAANRGVDRARATGASPSHPALGDAAERQRGEMILSGKHGVYEAAPAAAAAPAAVWGTGRRRELQLCGSCDMAASAPPDLTPCPGGLWRTLETMTVTHASQTQAACSRDTRRMPFGCPDRIRAGPLFTPGRASAARPPRVRRASPVLPLRIVLAGLNCVAGPLRCAHSLYLPPSSQNVAPRVHRIPRGPGGSSFMGGPDVFGAQTGCAMKVRKFSRKAEEMLGVVDFPYFGHPKGM